MHATSSAVALGLLLVLGSLSVPLAEGSDEPLRELATEAVDKAVAWLVEVPPGGTLKVGAGGDTRGANALGYVFAFQPADASEPARKVIGRLSRDGQRVHVAVGEAAAAGVTAQADCLVFGLVGNPALDYCMLEKTVTYRPSHPGLWYVLGSSATDGAFDGRLRLLGTEGTRVLARAEGQALLAQEESFRGEATLYAHGAVAVLDGAYAVEAAGRMYAWYTGQSDAGPLTMGYEGPEGAHAGLTDYLLLDRAPGAYTFHLEHVDDHFWDGRVFLVGADFVLPPVPAG